MAKGKILLIIFVFLALVSLAYSEVSISNYDYIYENLSREILVYKDKLVIVESEYNIANDTWSEEYNYTTSFYIGYEIEYYEGKRIGIKINDREIYGYVNVEDNILSQWSVPIGDRNFKEYGRCRAYEIDKGVCRIIWLLK